MYLNFSGGKECTLGWLITQLTITAAPLNFCIRKTQFNKPVPVCYLWPCEVTDNRPWGLLVPLLAYLLPTDLGTPAWWIREDSHLKRQVCIMGKHCSISASHQLKSSPVSCWPGKSRGTVKSETLLWSESGCLGSLYSLYFIFISSSHIKDLSLTNKSVHAIPWSKVCAYTVRRIFRL